MDKSIIIFSIASKSHNPSFPLDSYKNGVHNSDLIKNFTSVTILLILCSLNSVT